MAENNAELAQEMIPYEERPSTGSVLDDLKERVSSPFIFSYLLAFVISNWKIWIGLLYYDQSTLVSLGYRSHVDYIYRETDLMSLVLLPTLSALLYCLVYPLLRNYIKVIQTEYSTSVNRRVNEIASNGSIPTTRFIALKIEYDRLIKSVTTFLSQNNSAEIEHLQLQNVDLQNRVQNYADSLGKWVEYNSIKLMTGEWAVDGGGNTTQTVYISGVDVFQRIGQGRRKTYRITIYHCNPDAKTITMFLERTNQDNNRFNLHGLHVLSFDTPLELSGVIKGEAEIVWRKISMNPNE